MTAFNFITNQGAIIADTSTTREQVEAEFKEVFGDDFITEPSTPQGALITRIVEERDAVARNNAELANQINPSLAGGIFLDALSALTGSSRRASTKSIINGAIFGGVPGTIIPEGSIAETGENVQFATTANVIIGSNGQATGSLRAIEYGAISVPANGLNHVASSVLGWETITNPTASVVGSEQESDAELRRRRRQTLALQTTSINEAIVSRLYDIESVHSVYYLENYENTTLSIRGITLQPHSIWACVYGGTDEEVAKALFDTKTAGTGYNGNISVLVTDQTNGRQYEVNFDRPDEINVLIRVTATSNTLDLQSLIPDLVMNYVNGDLEGDSSFKVGTDISPFEISGAINQQEPSIFVKNVELSVVGSGSWSNSTLAIAPNQIARTQVGSIYVVVA